MKRNVYLASRYSNQAKLRDVRTVLELHGHNVVSSWLDTPVSADDDARRDLNPDPQERVGWAHKDLADLNRADTFVLIDPSGKRGGCYVELGYALACSMDCFVVGDRTNVFTYLCVHVAAVVDLPSALTSDWVQKAREQ